MALLEIKNLSFTYSASKTKALENIDLTINNGDFVLLCGESGCGKTTLLKLIKKQLRPNGKLEGNILFDGIDIDQLDERKSVSQIGYVMQNPDNQTVTDKVWHELAFGLESLGEKTEVIRRKIAEICGFFGINEWYHKNICELSGGQKQLVALASIMVMNPSILILDEPTSQLDPIAASEFLQALYKINQELGITIIIAEHRLEEVYQMVNKVVLMDKSKIYLCDAPRKIAEKLSNDDVSLKMSYALPTPIQIYNKTGKIGECPLTVNEGKQYIINNFNNKIKCLEESSHDYKHNKVVIELKDGYFKYERELPDILKEIDLKVYNNELLCILGANGAGKTTLLRVLSGVKRLYKGKYRLFDKKIKEYNGNTLYRENIACLPQNPQNLFVKNTVYEDLLEVGKILELKKEEIKKDIDEISNKLSINHLFKKHPYDLSGGEQQKVALAKILLMKPKILLLDEPTKGLDAYYKITFANILKSLQKEGKTIIMVTHDVEFAAMYANRCAMFFDGQIVSIDETINFFSTNRYYTTSASRMSKPYFENAITMDMVAKLCNLNFKEHTND